MTYLSQRLQEARRAIFYEILSWHEDEGEYQPTQEEAEEKVKNILTRILQDVLEKIVPEEQECHSGEHEKLHLYWNSCRAKILSNAEKLGVKINIK